MSDSRLLALANGGCRNKTLPWEHGGQTPDESESDRQIDALVKASGHTWADAALILSQLHRSGWCLKQITAESV